MNSTQQPSTAGAIVEPRERALAEVRKERIRQHQKWGEQNHPDGTGPDRYVLSRTEVNLDLRVGTELAIIFRDKTDRRAHDGIVTYKDILLEEVFEALAESDKSNLRTELIQVAAVAVAWVEKLDREMTA